MTSRELWPAWGLVLMMVTDYGMYIAAAVAVALEVMDASKHAD